MKTFEPKSIPDVYLLITEKSIGKECEPIEKARHFEGASEAIDDHYAPLLAAYTTLQTELAQVRKEREWVSVAERLPGFGEKVLCLRADNILMGRLNINGWSLFYKDGESLVSKEMPVEYWMPLPTAPDNLK